jgi:hypothetical protein
MAKHGKGVGYEKWTATHIFPTCRMRVEPLNLSLSQIVGFQETAVINVDPDVKLTTRADCVLTECGR